MSDRMISSADTGGTVLMTMRVYGLLPDGTRQERALVAVAEGAADLFGVPYWPPCGCPRHAAEVRAREDALPAGGLGAAPAALPPGTGTGAEG